MIRSFQPSTPGGMIFARQEDNRTSLLGNHDDRGDVELLDFHLSASGGIRSPTTTTASSRWSTEAVGVDRDNLFGLVLSTFSDAIVVDQSADDYSDWPTAGLEDVDTSHMKYPGAFRHIPPWEFAVKVTMYGLIILLALVGNAAVIMVVARNKRMHTPTNYFIVNLAVSDILVTSMCTWVHLVHDVTEGWVLGAFFCKINSFAQVLSLVSSILTLTLIACDRFFGIVFAMKARVTERRSPLLIAGVWIGAVSLSSPLLVYREQSVRHWLDHTEIWCDDTWPPHRVIDPVTHQMTVTHPSRTIYYSFISAVLYFLPIVVMTIAYALIIWTLWSSKRPGEALASDTRTHDRIKKRVVVMLVILLSVFAICWLPYQITILYAEYRINKSAELPDWHFKFSFFANFVAFSNSAFNPIIYTGFNENFRRGFRNMCRCRRKLDENVYGCGGGVGGATTAVAGGGLHPGGAMTTCTASLTTTTLVGGGGGGSGSAQLRHELRHFPSCRSLSVITTTMM